MFSYKAFGIALGIFILCPFLVKAQTSETIQNQSQDDDSLLPHFIRALAISYNRLDLGEDNPPYNAATVFVDILPKEGEVGSRKEYFNVKVLTQVPFSQKNLYKAKLMFFQSSLYNLLPITGL